MSISTAQAQPSQPTIKITKYAGIPGDPSVSAWINQQKKKYYQQQVNDDKFIATQLTLYGLIGPALEWMGPYLEQDEADWDARVHPCSSTKNLELILKQRTGQYQDRATIAERKMQVLTQKGRPVNQYIQKYLALKTQMDPKITKNEPLMARHFWSGLDERITRQLAAVENVEKWTDQKWIERVRQMEEFQAKDKIRHGWFPKEYQQPKQTRTYDPWAMEVDKTYSGPRRKRYRNNYYGKRKPRNNNCHKCGKPGHWARNCFMNKDPNAMETNATRRGNPRRKSYFKKRNNYNRNNRNKRRGKPFGQKAAYIETREESEQDFH